MVNKRLKIISGGQTGVDRAALDVAMMNNRPCGGWCPVGRKAEDGRIPAQYPLTELENGDYRHRTIRNLSESDGTVIIYFEYLYGGTRLTHDWCIQHWIPCLMLDAAKLSVEQAAQQVIAFIDCHTINVLNVAGPRASEHSAAYRYAYQVMSQALE